jgi:hypothetical protein
MSKETMDGARGARQILEGAYDNAFHMFFLMKDIRRNPARAHVLLNETRTSLLEASLLLDLTLHARGNDEWSVTTTDLAVMEGILSRLVGAVRWTERNALP